MRVIDQEICTQNCDFWLNEIKKLEERPDMCGILKNEVKKKVNLIEYSSKNELKFESLDENISVNFKETLNLHPTLNLELILSFIWQNVFCIYGNSKQTVIGRIFLNEDSKRNQLLTSHTESK
jgi:hypothetical protein